MRTPWLLALLPLLACAASHPAAMDAESTHAAQAGGAPSANALEGRALVIQAVLQLEREDPEAGPLRAAELAKAHGGYLQQSSKESATVRIPAERLEAFLAGVGTLGKVQEATQRREDVTEARQDLKVRLDNLRRTRERYLGLLDRAANVTEAVAVERELERVTTEYEVLKARVDAMEGSIALSTVRLDFARPINPGPIGWVFRGLYLGVKWLFVWD